MGSLTNQVALVTGASRGFGRATALCFAEEGADVVVNYHSAREEAEEVATFIHKLGRRALVVQADVSDREQVHATVEKTMTEFGRIDILVNNAGVLDIKPFMEQNRVSWEAMMAVNIDGVLWMTEAVLPVMKEQGAGRIVNLSSQLGHVGGENFAVYSGTKAFVLAYTKSLAREVGQFGVRVNSVCPGSIVTDMNRGLYSPEKAQARARELPLRHLGHPVDVAHAVLFLASDQSSFITGQCVDVNGGSTMA